ncbi:hypothetical protein AgCh_026051 [Apium graveolens]
MEANVSVHDDSMQELPIIIDDQVEDNRACNHIPDDFSLSDFLNCIAEMDGDVAVQELPVADWEDLEQMLNEFANFEQVEAALAIEHIMVNDQVPDCFKHIFLE